MIRFLKNWWDILLILSLMIGVLCSLPALIRLRITIDTWVLNHVPTYVIIGLPVLVISIIICSVFAIAYKKGK